MDKILQGTEVHAEGAAGEVCEDLLALKARGERHELGTRLCHFALFLASLGSFGALFLEEPWWFGGLAGVAIFFYYLPTTFDPELAEDERLDFVIAVLSAIPKTVDVSLWAQLNAYEYMAPDSREALSSGRVFEKWTMPWLRLVTADKTLHGELRAQRVEDGLQMLDELVELEVTDGDNSVLVDVAKPDAWPRLTEFCTKSLGVSKAH